MIMVWERKMDYEKDSFWRLTHTMMETILWLYHTLEDLQGERLKGKRKRKYMLYTFLYMYMFVILSYD